MAGPNLIAIGSSEPAQKALKVSTKLCSLGAAGCAWPQATHRARVTKTEQTGT